MINPLENLLIGRTLCDRYRIEEVIGRGGMSVVYRAFDQRLGRPVALKVVSLPVGDDSVDGMRARLRREAASAARIPAHPNIVHIYDYGTDEELDLDFIVMELLIGRDLKAAMKAGDLTMEEALRVIREAARGIAAGHAAGIVHRDVKPANIFLIGETGVESAKILDFGIAKALEVEPEDDLTRADSTPHSPAYASPEQARGEKAPSPASDVFQLGLVAYELLAGARPFMEEERALLARGAPVPLPARGRWLEVPREIRQSVEIALRPRANDRYPDAGGMAEALGFSRGPRDHRLRRREALSDEGSPDANAARATDETILAPDTGRSFVAPQDDARGPGAHRHPERSEGHPDSRPVPQSDETALAPDTGRSLIADSPQDHTRVAPPLGPPERNEGSHDTHAAPPSGTRRAPAPFRIFQFAGAAVLAVVALWAIIRIGGGTESQNPGADLDIAALHEEFRPIVEEATARQLTVPMDDEAAAAAEVERVILEMNQAWVRGDLDRHVAHYADRVDFYNSYGAPRSYIASERGDALDRYPDREITITRTAITFPRSDRARALIDKSWRFADGDDDEWSGSARQELILERRNGVWRVVSERDEQVY